MRPGVLGLAVLLLFATTGNADVRITTRNGKKVIYNIPSGRSSYSNFEWLAKQHDRRTRFDPWIEQYARQYRVDPVLVHSLRKLERAKPPRVALGGQIPEHRVDERVELLLGEKRRGILARSDHRQVQR